MAKKKPNSPLTLEQVVSDFKQSWNYVSGSYHTLWDDCFKLYNNERVDKAYEGITDTFVPMTFTTVEVMVAAIAGGKPKFTYVPQKILQTQDTEPLNALVDYFWDCDKWSTKVIQWVRSMLMYGTGVLYVWWDIDKPKLEHVPIRDFFFDPTASGPDSSKYMGRRYLTTLDELKKIQIIDPQTGEMTPKYSNLDQVKMKRAGDEDTDKEQKDMFMGSTLGDKATESQVEVIEYWTEDREYVVANREVTLYDEENTYKARDRDQGAKYPKGLIPFVVQRDYIDESLFLGKGEIEPIIGEQELLNDLTNQNMDSVTYSLNQMYTLDPKYADWIEKVENLPGAVYPFEAGALNPVVHAPVPQDAFQERANLKTEIRETTAANEIFGLNMNQGKTTATQINSIQAQVGERFQIKIDQLEQDGFHQLGQIVFKLIQLYMQNPQPIRVSSMEGTSWKLFDPASFQGDYEPMVQLQSSVDKKQAVDSQKYQALYTTMLSNPFVNQLELTKFILQKEFDLDPDEVGVLVKDPQEMAQEQMMMGAQQPGGAPTPGDVAGMPPQPGVPLGR